MTWNRDSWREFNILQQPTYPNLKELKEAEEKLKALPPLVFAGEARSLKNELAKVCNGEAFCFKVATALRALQILTQTTSEICLRSYFKWR